jgi:putative ABC transport system permease protein
MDSIRQDLAFAFRQIRRSPGFALTVILTLGLGVGANTAIFSVVNGVLLEPLPYAQPDRLVRGFTRFDNLGFEKFWFSWGQYNLLREQNNAYEDLAVYGHTQSINVSGTDRPLQIQGAAITHTLLPTLGVAPVLGRNFTEQEDQLNSEPVAILGHSVWERLFGGRADIVGTSVELNGTSRQIVGVMPEGFVLPTEFGNPEPAAVWIPLARQHSIQPGSGNQNFNLVGRLSDGATVERADQNIKQVFQHIHETAGWPETINGFALPLKETVVGDVRLALLVLLGAVGFVLLIACANVANLMLARSESRGREIAVRVALGAKRGRLLRQLLTEATVLSLCGGAVALGLAHFGVKALLAVDPTSVPRASGIAVDPTVLGFTFILSIVTGLLFGLVPAIHATKPDLQETLKEGDRGTTVGASRLALRRALAVSEIALSLLLAVGAGLMMKSFWTLRAVDPGLDPESVLAFNTSLPAATYSDAQQVTSFYERLLDGVGELPGVQSVALVNQLPIGGSNFDWSFQIEGRQNQPDQQTPNADYNVVSYDYLPTMRMSLLRGRGLSEFDRDSANPAVVINETMAAMFWEGEDAIGKRISLFGPPVWHEVVGILRDVKSRGLAVQPRPEMYLEQRQMRVLGANFRNFSVVVRTVGDPRALVDPIRTVFRGLDPTIPFAQVQTIDEMIAGSLAQERFSMLLLSVFAVVALALAAVGIYGVMAYTVAQRTHEIGVRMALGADQRRVRRLIVRQGMRVAVVGLGLGVALALVLTRVLESLLFGVSTTDALIFIAVPAVLTGVALLSNWIPALQASSGDPLRALRNE